MEHAIIRLRGAATYQSNKIKKVYKRGEPVYTSDPREIQMALNNAYFSVVEDAKAAQKAAKVKAKSKPGE